MESTASNQPEGSEAAAAAAAATGAAPLLAAPFDEGEAASDSCSYGSKDADRLNA